MPKDVIISDFPPSRLVQTSLTYPIGSLKFEDQTFISLEFSSQSRVKLAKFLKEKEQKCGASSVHESPTDMLALQILTAMQREVEHVAILTSSLGVPS